MRTYFFILAALIPIHSKADTWSCDGRSSSVIAYRNRVEVTDVSINTQELNNDADTLAKTIQNMEALLDQKNKIKNVCNFPAVIDQNNLKTHLTWIYTLKWKTKDETPGTATTEIVIDVDHWDEFDAKVNRIMKVDQSSHFFTITTLCSYFCR